MKKLMLSLVALVMAMNVNAQKFLNDSETPFEQGKFFVGASLSGASFSYSKSSDWNLGVSGRVGYFFLDNWMAQGVLDYESYNNFDYSYTKLGAGVRYYFDNIGIFVGGLAQYVHNGAADFDDFSPEIQAGYSFFLGRHITIEPEIYYQHSFKESDYSGIGGRIGFGIYF